MSTVAQINANQINALKSTGPVTAEGKDASSRNATTHGITSSRIHAPEAAAFEAYLAEFTSTFDPKTDTERAFTRRCAEYQVRIDRANVAEASLMQQHVDLMMENVEGISREMALGAIFTTRDFTRQLGLVMRYHSQATRGYDHTARQLTVMIKQRREAEEYAAVEAGLKAEAEKNAAASPISAAEAGRRAEQKAQQEARYAARHAGRNGTQPVATTPVSENGFVSQNGEPAAPKPVIRISGTPSLDKMRAEEQARIKR